MRGQRSVTLRQARQTALPPGDVAPLIDLLHEERERLARDRQVAPAEVLADWVLRDLAHIRPSTLEITGSVRPQAHGSVAAPRPPRSPTR